jgi:hypothetical protein
MQAEEYLKALKENQDNLKDLYKKTSYKGDKP